mmetsp:Transcript_1779/g.6193  ORF Transcript_1779/g.6193 Transcript_1779/m.6193 type:complete len:378 (-) Transcript_1779:608-1741(-)
MSRASAATSTPRAGVSETAVTRFGQGVGAGAAAAVFSVTLRRTLERRARARALREHNIALESHAMYGDDEDVKGGRGFDRERAIEVFNRSETSMKEREEQLADMRDAELGKLSEKAFEKIYGVKAPQGFGSVMVAHFTAPMSAYGGDGAAAVDTVCKAIGGMMGGVVGGPVGAFIGEKVLGSIPGAIINYFDTSNVQAQIRFVNYSPHFIKFTSNQSDYYPSFSIMHSENAADTNQGGYNSAKGITMPPAATAKRKDNKATYITWQTVWNVKSKYACASFQLAACRFPDGQELKTYDVAFQYPGEWANAWTGRYTHQVGIFENSGWGRVGHGHDNYEPLYKMQEQHNTGRDNRPHAGSSGKCVGYWENWETLVFEFH